MKILVKYELMLSDGSTVTADHKATVELRNFDGSYTAGYLHKKLQLEVNNGYKNRKCSNLLKM